MGLLAMVTLPVTLPNSGKSLREQPRQPNAIAQSKVPRIDGQGLSFFVFMSNLCSAHIPSLEEIEKPAEPLD
jgi:hypothetical protein